MLFSLITLGVIASPQPPGTSSTSGRYVGVAVVKIMTIVFCDLTNIAFPTPLRTGLIWVSMLLRLVELLLITAILHKYEKYSGSKVVAPKLDDPRDLDEGDLRLTVRVTKKFATLRAIRNSCYRRYKLGLSYFGLLSFLLFLSSIGNFTAEMAKTVSSLGEFIAPTQVTIQNNQETQASYFGTNRTSTTKTVIMVLDGLNQYGLENSPRMQALIKNSTFAKDAWVHTIRATIPTMSVPNWMALITGSTPEMTGVWGNLLIPETTYDSLFRQARLFNLNRGITSSGWFTALIKNQLQPLFGDGTVDLLYDPSGFSGGRQSNNAVDELRGETLMTAVRQTNNPYQLFVSHFSDIDFQGHYYGADKKYNSYNSYLEAVDNKTKLMEQVIDTIDSDTLLIAVSDHGMVASGGHGGVTPDVLHMPMIVYRKNSGLGAEITTPTYDGPKFNTGSNNISIIDIAPTVAALMGMPVPRQNQGRFIDELMFMMNKTHRNLHFEDLYRQTRQFVIGYLETIAATQTLKDNALVKNLETGKTDEEYKALIVKLRDFFATTRQDTLDAERLRNILATLLLDGVIAAVLLYTLQKYSFIQPFSLMSLKSSHEMRRKNAVAFLWSVVLTMLYFGLSIGFFWTLNFTSGYLVWDSTFLHTPESVISYFIAVIAPTVLFALLFVRSFFALFGKSTRKMGQTGWDRIKHTIGRLFSIFIKPGRHDTDMGMVYLTKYYTMQTANLVLLVLFVFQAMFTFLVPNIFRINYVTEDTWGFRFRVITVQFMAYPWVLANMFSLRDMPNSSTNQSGLDDIYELFFEKQLTNGKIDQEGYEALVKIIRDPINSEFDFKEMVDYYKLENALEEVFEDLDNEDKSDKKGKGK